MAEIIMQKPLSEAIRKVVNEANVPVMGNHGKGYERKIVNVVVDDRAYQVSISATHIPMEDAIDSKEELKQITEL